MKTRATTITKLLGATVVALVLCSSAQAASITIPAIHVRDKVTADVDAGPAWWPVTGRPGGGDTVAIAGHRTTHSRPFHDLDKLRPGDKVYVRWGGRPHAYVVTSSRILSVTNLHIADWAGHERLILTSCARRDGSPTSASYRIVVYALPVAQ